MARKSKLGPDQIATMVGDVTSGVLSVKAAAGQYGISPNAVAYHVKKANGGQPAKRRGKGGPVRADIIPITSDEQVKRHAQILIRIAEKRPKVISQLRVIEQLAQQYPEVLLEAL